MRPEIDGGFQQRYVNVFMIKKANIYRIISGINAIFEMLRNILHEGQLEKRIQYMIEVMFQVRKDGFKDHAAIIEELDLIQEEHQFTHLITLEDVKAGNSEDILSKLTLCWFWTFFEEKCINPLFQMYLNLMISMKKMKGNIER